MKTTDCKLCEEDSEVGMRGFAMHLRGSHDMEMNEYLKDHVESVPGYTRCEICGEPTDVKEEANGEFTTCSNECKNEYKRRNWQGEDAPWHGKSHSEETKQRISEKKKEEYADPEDHPMYGREHSEETKRKISRAHKELYENGYENPMKGVKRDEDVIQNLRSYHGKTDIERIMEDILEDLGLEYTYDWFLNGEDVLKCYDFRIKGTDTLIEVDGDYWHGGPGSEHHFGDANEVRENDRFKDEFARQRGYEVLRFWGSEVRQDPEKVATQIQNKTEQ